MRTCERCGSPFVPKWRSVPQRFCSRSCGTKHRRNLADRAVVAWWQCSDCGTIRGLNGQAKRKAYRAPAHRCAVPEANIEPLCLRCGRVRDTRYCGCWTYVPVEPHPTVCKRCGDVFVGKWQRYCQPCRSLNGMDARRAARTKDRARRRGIPRESYRPTTVFERDGWRCHLCGKAVNRGRVVPHPMAPTIDHLIPVSAGGADVMTNVATAHFECNSRRQAGGIAQLRLIA